MTAIHLFVVLTYTPLVGRLPGARVVSLHLRVVYEDAQGVLRHLISYVSQQGYSVSQLAIEREPDRGRGDQREEATIAPEGHGAVSVAFEVRGRGDRQELAVGLSELAGVLRVELADASAVADA